MKLSGNLETAFTEYANLCLKDGYKIDEENNIQLQKVFAIFKKNDGVYLKGNPGSGKTFIMEVLNKITSREDKRHFIVLDAFQIVKTYNDNYEWSGDKVLFNWNTKNILINELGLEEKGIYQSEVMMKFILFRHRLWITKKINTHFTTNLSNAEIDQRYSSAIRSRMIEMSHKIMLGEKANSVDRRTYRNFISFPKVTFD